MSKLLIVESPAKAKTIGKYLGGDFVVLPSVGHIRDLPKSGGILIKITPVADEKNKWTFDPVYEISADKKQIVAELRKVAKASDAVYLAPDPDREGEAIAWHLKEVLEASTKGKPVYRVSYNEITKSAVSAAIASPRDVDMNRVNAQQARRVLDRLVGFKVSPMLWRYLKYGNNLSAGRVQSAALRILVDREREIRDFKPEVFFIIGVEAKKGESAPFIAKLAKYDGKKPAIHTQDEAAMAIDDLDGSTLTVKATKERPRSRHAKPPFTTSTLQQAASSYLGYNPSKTMSVAQKLYEAGLITYMRTDSVNVSDQARAQTAEYIRAKFGEKYLPEKPNFYKSKSGAQEAHEAIHPTNVSERPSLANDERKLYDLILNRFLASQMAPTAERIRSVEIEADKVAIRHSYVFTASATTIDFEGWLKVYGKTAANQQKDSEDKDAESDEVKSLPPLVEGDEVTAVRWLNDRRETEPPRRFSEASLIKALEDNGVGRPSTYASTIETLVKRQYADRETKARVLTPTQRGMDVNDWLAKRLPELFDVGYTAKMESALDVVESGETGYNDMLSDFYARFNAWLENAQDPPPPKEKFEGVFKLLDCVTKWKEPVKIGARLLSDKGFVDSVKEQMAANKTLSEKQLMALVRLAIGYRDQIPNGEMAIIDLGWGPELDRVKNAPSADLVRWCFQTIDRIGGMEHNPFIRSLREQVDRGRQLSQKQFMILARSVGENASALPDGVQVRQRLSPYVGGVFETAPVDPAVPEILKLLEGVTTWKEPVRRGKKVYDDKEFVTSLRNQYARRTSLSERQAEALRRVAYTYREQIPTYAEVAKRLGIDKLPGREKIESAAAIAEKDAKRAARAEARKARQLEER